MADALQRKERDDGKCRSSDDGRHCADLVSEIDKLIRAGAA